MGGKGKRPGRPWAPPRGTCTEINQLVELMRSWIDQSSLSVAQLHKRLTPEHFVAKSVPELRRLRDLLTGESLEWDLVEAMADVCFPDEPVDRSGQRLEAARALWDRAQASPSPLEGSQELVLARELLAAKDRTIEVYQEMQRARTAYEASERGRHQALQIATLLFAMLGQAHAKVAELKRRFDALQTLPATAPQEHKALELRLDRAQRQELELRQQLERAERERDTAQQVADHAARHIQALQGELAALRIGAGHDEPPLPHDLTPHLPQPELNAVSHDDVELDDVDRALKKARAVLDEEHEAVQQAADDMGYRTTPADDPAVKIIPGQVQRAHEPESPAKLDGPVELSRTTTNNSRLSSEMSVAVTKPPKPLSADHLRFIGAATRRIARGIDLDEIVLGLCRATVPTFSDAIIVYLRDPLPVGDERITGPVILRLRRVYQRPDEEVLDQGLLQMPDPDQSLPVLRLIAEWCEAQPGSALAEVLKGVRPIFADTPIGSAALPELLGLEYAVPTGQHIILAPLRGRRRIIGAAVFLRRADRTAFEADDLLVAAPLATHTALGIDKAVLYGLEAYRADELQRTMLPASLPCPDGMRLASRYLPAADTSRVGGDWYDVIPLPGARVALVIGDVMGHSMTSAAVMGQLRSTLKTLAQQDLAPYEVLHQVDDIARDLGTDRMATCLCAVYDPVAHQITIANAGHPPPLLLQPNGHAEILQVPAGIPLGVGGADFEEVELDAPVLGTLLLYTDGLVESRIRDVWTGIEQLREKLGSVAQLTGPDHPPSLEALCDEVLDMLGPGDRDDDTALLAVRFDGIPPSDVASCSLEPEDAAPQHARQFALAALDQWQLSNASEVVGLLVEEVVRSAVQYATRPITLKLLRRQVIRCEVGDDTPRLPRLSRVHPPGDNDLHHLLRNAHRWGTNRLSTGKIVWFEVAIP